jgi:hypothetical protein
MKALYSKLREPLAQRHGVMLHKTGFLAVYKLFRTLDARRPCAHWRGAVYALRTFQQHQCF